MIPPRMLRARPACVLMFALTALAQTAIARPNFIFILADDLGYGDLGCYGNKFIHTPNLDRMASEGIRLTSCYAPSAVCSPSRAGILTGRWPDRAGIHEIVAPGSAMELREDQVSIAGLLREHGYATAIFGKWHLSVKLEGDHPTPRTLGFDHWLCTADNALVSHKDPVNFYLNGQPLSRFRAYSNDILVRQSLNWLIERKGAVEDFGQAGQPYCLFVWLHSPHERIASPPDLVRRYSQDHEPPKAEYYANVAHMDRALGEFMDELRTLGMADNTLVMFTSDNGPEDPERFGGAERSHGSAGPLRGGKLHLYEGGIRVPGILWWPDKIAPDQTLDTPVSGLDVFPTFCELAGIEPPAGLELDGTSLVPLLKSAKLKRSKPLYWQCYRGLGGPKAALRAGDFKILADWDGPEFDAWTPMNAQLQSVIAGAKLRHFELYNLRTDPSERHDLSRTHPMLTAWLGSQLQICWNLPPREWPQWP